MSPPVNRDVWTVSRLNLEVRTMLEANIGEVWVEGEISNLARPRSGHIYFTLKDQGAQVRCAMFRSRMRGLDFVPENGLQVLARARAGLYAERGEFQLVVEALEEAGAGELRRAFEQLKARLAAEGLFDADRKQPLPAIPDVIGVITSPSGAAVRDIITTLARRFPAAEVIIYPVPVQGDAAAPAIEAALATAARRNECDLLIVGRGGGSLEDLWAFNEERTARAIAACPLPVVSAVGHETDFTIADFVADARAPTPTGAAELVSPDTEALARRIDNATRRMTRHLVGHIATRRQRVDLVRRRIRHPSARLQDLAQRLDALTQRAERALRAGASARTARLATLRARLAGQHPSARLRQSRAAVDGAHDRLVRAMNRQLDGFRARVREPVRALSAIGPQATLARGYAIVTRDADGSIVRDAGALRPGEPVTAQVANGKVRLKVE